MWRTWSGRGWHTRTWSGDVYTTAPPDPDFGDVEFLLRNGESANTFVDASSNAATITRVGDAATSAELTPSGVASVYFDGTGDSLTAPDSANYSFPGVFTVESWVKYVATSGRENRIVGRLSGESGWVLRYTGTALRWYSVTTGVIDKSWSASLDTWYHVAVCRDESDDLRMFVDGTQIGTTTNTSADFTPAAAAVLVVGHTQTYGYIADTRITKGVARYTANFTRPDRPLPTQ